MNAHATTDQQAKLRFLATASAELASSLDYQATLRGVAQMAVPWFADWCAGSLAQDGRLHTLAVAHVDPTKRALAEDMERRYPADPDVSQSSYAVLRGGRSELILDVSDEMLVAAAKDDQRRRLLRELNFRSALVVPLTARERALGVIMWATGDEGRRFTPADVQFGEDLAGRAAVAIENAQLHTELREVAVQLQRAVLARAVGGAFGLADGGVLPASRAHRCRGRILRRRPFARRPTGHLRWRRHGTRSSVRQRQRWHRRAPRSALWSPLTMIPWQC